MATKSQSAKSRKCKVCKTEFVPLKPLQNVCDFGCAVELAVSTRIKKEAKEATRKRVETRKAKESIKTRSDWMKEAQIVFNKYRKDSELAKGEGCISCGTKNGKMNCGHYRSVGSTPELRFNELNTWLQCEKCNSYLSGNLINYRINLVKKIGIEQVEWLEGPHDPKKYSISDLQEIKRIYKEKLKNLTSDN